MNHTKNIKKLEKFIFYVLGKRPDEFGLLPDSEGYISIKELVRAISEESEYRYIRESHIKEIFITSTESLFETQEYKIRAKDRSGIVIFDNEIPKILYYGVKRKSYGHVLDKGLYPNHGDLHLLLSSDRDMALRIAKRRDQKPVIITVPVTTAISEGVDLNRRGETIYISRHIPSSCISGPPLEKIIGIQQPKEATKPSSKPENFTPGSFLMKFGEETNEKRGKKDWKNSKKRLRKEKKHSWPDE